LVEVVVSLVLSLHLLCVNVAVAAPLICLWCEWREARGSSLAGELGRFLARSAVVLFCAGMLAGLLVGVLVWSDKYASVLSHLESKVLFGIAELVFSLVLLTVYVPWWNRFPVCSKGHRALRSLLPLLAGTNLMYHFPLLFVIISNLTQLKSVPKGTLDAAGFRELMVDGEVIARVVHFWLASVAVTGGLIVWRAWRMMRDDTDNQKAASTALWGGRIAALPTILQLPVGIWLVLELPRGVQNGFMGGNLAATVLFGTSLVMALWLMHKCAAVALGDTKPRTLVAAMIAMIVVVVLMTGTLRAAKSTRSAALPAATVLSFPHRAQVAHVVSVQTVAHAASVPADANAPSAMPPRPCQIPKPLINKVAA